MEVLERDYKTKWRKSPTESRFFNRRKSVYHAIIKMIDEGMTEAQAVVNLEL